MSASANPLEVVHNLVGITLPEGWVVKEKIKRETSDTGGYFSVSYLVEKTSGEAAFMKVLNLAKALTMPGDQLRNIQNLITTFNFERDTLDVCRSNNFKRVATALSHGKLEIPGNIFGVYYIIFELAQGCIRKHMAKIGSLDRMWILRSLHHTANGIRQLHSKKISHQDIKPSNVLIFSGVESKVADLGCADIKYGASPRGGLMVAGDQSYAPIELLYGEVSPLWERRRMGTDMYLLAV